MPVMGLDVIYVLSDGGKDAEHHDIGSVAISLCHDADKVVDVMYSTITQF